ncbi:hypothetical protein Hte_012061 [Hypoxylon texense]
MRSTASRALLRQSLARPGLTRAHYTLSRGFVAAHTSSSSSSSSSSSALSSLRPLPDAPNLPRPFHTTACAGKSKGKSREPEWRGKAPKDKIREDRQRLKENALAARADGDGDAATEPGGGPKHPPPDPEAPLDFADVASRLARHDEHFRDSLKKLRSGGRFNPDAIGSLRVPNPERKSADAAAAAAAATHYPLREVAQVVPRGGRTISILANEAAWVKPIMSAVQASADFNQQPQRAADSELELTLKIEPERRDDLARRAKALCHEWRDRVRSVRQKRDKLHATWKQERAIGPDLKRTADKELEKIVKAKMAEIDDVEKEALKAAEGAAK